MRTLRLLLASFILALDHTPVLAGFSGDGAKVSSEPCGSTPRLVVITGNLLPGLVGVPVDRIALFRWTGSVLEPIVFQIDRKDNKDRYILSHPTDAKPIIETGFFDTNDELALFSQDAGYRITGANEGVKPKNELVELEAMDEQSGSSRWLYAKKDAQITDRTNREYIKYFPSKDRVTTEEFKLGFSSDTPFLVDSLQWRTDSGDGWSPDVIDIMKIRHIGKLLGFIPFERHSGDYSSDLVAVKQGPIRIIRRTKNQVRMLWKLKTPTLLIDYVISPDGFVMDTIIDMPFPVGLFFSDAITLTTVDWNSAADLPVLYISSATRQESLQIDGAMGTEKTHFNTLAMTDVNVDSSLGNIHMKVVIPDDFPIKPYLYLLDDRKQIDEPEQDPGQFGNVGFRTTGWENIDTEVHHMEFRACLASKQGTTKLSGLGD